MIGDCNMQFHWLDSDTLEFKSEDSSDTLTDDESVNRDKVHWDYFESRPKSKKGGAKVTFKLSVNTIIFTYTV